MKLKRACESLRRGSILDGGKTKLTRHEHASRAKELDREEKKNLRS